MNVKTLPVGQMKANCYLVWDAHDEAIIIDPGDDADLIINHIQDGDLKPRAIIGTHGHFDHLMAVLELKLAFQIPFYLHKDDIFLLNRMDRTAVHFLGYDPGPPPDVDVILKQAANITIGQIDLEVMETPGHTPGSVCLYSKEDNILFSGDTIFEGGMVGRTDFKYSNKRELLKSVGRILSLPRETLIFSGHGEETTVQELKGLLQ